MKLRPLLSILYSVVLLSTAFPTMVMLPESTLAQEAPSHTNAAALLAEADRLFQQGLQQYQVSQFREALQFWQRAWELYRDPAVQAAFPQESRQGEANTLGQLGYAYGLLGQIPQAIELLEQSLAIAREIGDSPDERLSQRVGEGSALSRPRNGYAPLGQYQQSIDFYEQALEVARELNNHGREATGLDNLGNVYQRLIQNHQAINFFEQSLAIAREIGDRAGEVSALSSLGNIYATLWQHQQAIDFYEQALEIAREIGSQWEAAVASEGLGDVYQRQGQYQRAIDFFEQSLAIAREINHRAGEGSTLGRLGYAYGLLGQNQQAIDLFEQSLAIARESGDRAGEGIALSNLGNGYAPLGQYQRAIDVYEQALEIAREIGSRWGEAVVLGSLGDVYQRLGQYQQALDFHEQSLAIAREINHRAGEGSILGRLGHTYGLLGQHQQAIDFFEQSLAIARESGDRAGEGSALSSLGNGYAALGQYQRAIDVYEQALEIAREIGSRWGETAALASLGDVYQRLGQYQQAIGFHEQSLAIAREIGDRAGEGSTLGRLGNAYAALGQYQHALETYQQALTIAQEIGDRTYEGFWLSTIGFLLAQQGQTELAIVFYKQSVNVRELIRADIRGLPQEQQEAYIATIADSYRELADLLLQQNRILEAQRVLDLLRVQELEDYLRGVRSTAQTENGIDLRDPEREISNRVIAVGYELAQLRDIPPTQLSEAQLQRLSELDATQRRLTADFQGFLNSPEIQALVAQLDASLQEQDILARADEFINLQNNLRDIDQNAVLIYPLILEDRLELVVVTPFSEPARYPVSVSATELNAAIVEFRQALDDPTSDPKPIAQRLYTWLIAPMASDLEALGAETILYAPDGALRYVPLAALHDGDQWLIERYRINHITAASLQDFTLRPDPQPKILAAAFSEGTFEFQVGQRSFSFGGLPFAGVEVENLAAAFPNTTQLMNSEFSRRLVEPIMDSHTIVHLATHAAFVPGSPADSFILFGNGDRLTLQEIRETWRGRFNRVDLIVLSACETGLGGDTLGNGEEILGFGYLMQESGAEAAIASLWSVSDGGTQVLIDAFYAALNNGYSKAEALQRAQQALITNDQTVLEGERGATVDIIDTRTGQPLSQSNDLAHPYYWAPFILIGNGL